MDAAPAFSRATVPAQVGLRARLPRGVGYALAWAVALRLTLSALAAWLLSLRPIHESAAIRAQYLGQTPLHDALLAPWQRFDALWYLRLAAHGYGAHDGSTVYFPLYPLLIKLVSVPLFGDGLLAALLISNLCCAGLLVVLYQLVAERHGDVAARRTLLLLCLFPTASFLIGAYTESLYLLLAVGCLLAAGHGRPSLAGALGLLAALTRLQGIVLALPLLWMALGGWRAGRRDARAWLAAALPPLGTLLFTLYTAVFVRAGLMTGVYTRQVHQQLSLPWMTLWSYWSALMAHHWHIFSYPTGNWVDALNLILALAMLALLVPARGMLGMPLWLYALATWMVTLCIHQSTARYMLTVFPALIVLAVWAPGRWSARLALLFGAPLMLFVAGEFVLWSFVG